MNKIWSENSFHALFPIYRMLYMLEWFEIDWIFISESRRNNSIVKELVLTHNPRCGQFDQMSSFKSFEAKATVTNFAEMSRISFDWTFWAFLHIWNSAFVEMKNLERLRGKALWNKPNEDLVSFDLNGFLLISKFLERNWG